MGANQHPFIIAALLSKRPSANQTTYSTRGGFIWAASQDEAKGLLLGEYLNEGYAVEILDVKPMARSEIAKMAEYFTKES